MRASSTARRLLVGLVLVLVLALGALGALGAAPTAVAAQDADEPATTEPGQDAESPVGDILPRPNSGDAPDSPNDPGGWQQYLVFAFLIGGIAAILMLVRRDSRKAKGASRD